ncbi:MAG: Aspartate/alanine antiporter [bacterium ADurb.Bin478]|nr:MAG: Aspartate/alanine antiporter [bacterium ADurb.Bin478]
MTILTLFVVIGLGYLLGEISFLGFRLGVAGVLFVGLAIGSLGPQVALPDVVASLGLIIFVYTVGIQSGPSFFQSFGKRGYRDALLAAGVLGVGAVVALLLGHFLGLGGPRAAGLYCGALTNTPALAAAREVSPAGRSGEAVVAYSIAYPFGVIGVLLCLQVLRRLWRVETEPAAEAPEIAVRDFIVKNPGVAGRSVAEVLRLHKDYGFVISRIRHDGRTQIARADTCLALGDVVAVVGDEEALERAQQIFGETTASRIEEDRSELDYRRLFVSNKAVVGKRISDLRLQDLYGATITRLRRGDIDVVPTPETRLEAGDRVRVLTHKSNFPAVIQLFGDSIKGTAETDFVSVALGMVLGVMVGLMPIPLPGGQTVRLGLAGGPLLVALVLGKLERSGRITWVMPVSANLTLRQVGLLLFLAAIGTRAGYGFVETLRTESLQLLLGGAAITLAVTLATLFVGFKLMRIPFDLLAGLASGVQTQPAALAFAANQTGSDAPNIGYASVYPVAMIAKIVLAQMLVAAL